MNAEHLTLAPVAPVALGFATSLIALRLGGRAERFARRFALFSAALALGLVLDLARFNAFDPVTLPLDPLSDPGGAVPIWPRLPAAATVAVLALVIAYFWNARPPVRRAAAVQAAALLTMLIAITRGTPGLPALWVGLLLVNLTFNLTFFVGNPDAQTGKTVRPAVVPPLVLLSVGAPLLWLAGTVGDTRLAGIILILVGVATADLEPLGGWRTHRFDNRFVEDGLLSVAGYVLAARGLAIGPPGLGPIVLLAALAVAGVAARGGEWRRASAGEMSRDGGAPAALGRALVAAGFVVLAAAFRLADLAVVGGLSVLVAGATVVVLAPVAAVSMVETGDVADPMAEFPAAAEDDDHRLGALAWDVTRSGAGRWAALLRVIEQHHDLALGLLVAIIAVFAFSS